MDDVFPFLMIMKNRSVVMHSEKNKDRITLFFFFIEEALKKAETNDMASSKRQL